MSGSLLSCGGPDKKSGEPVIPTTSLREVSRQMAGPIRRRSSEDAERELRVGNNQEPPGGAEGGDESNSADWLIDHPRDTDPLGDTDQHSDPENLPEHRERANQRRGENQRRS
jgi:hypothetical protein